jgi:hypothetical protein
MIRSRFAIVNKTLLRQFALPDDSAQQAMNSRVFWAGFAFIAVLATVIRFWDLAAAPLWRDEAVTLAFARLDLWTILTRNIDNHPPLTWVVQHFWHAINPDPNAARVPAATAGSLTVIFCMLALKDLAGQRAALFAGLIFALADGHIHYSQDARMYPFLVLGLTLAAWGAVGHARNPQHRPLTYAALYVAGGFIAIYSHAVGLIAMAMIGFASLAAGAIATAQPRPFILAWFARNSLLFVLVLPWLLAIPSAMGSFPGLGDVPVTHAHWYFRNMAGLPGIDDLRIPFEMIIIGMAVLSIAVAWLSGRRALALLLLGVTVIYPAIIVLLHLRPDQPILSNRAMTPVIITVAAGAGYALSMLRPKPLGNALIAVLAGVSLVSATLTVRHNVRLDDLQTAYAYADARGFTEGPYVTCHTLTAAAAWEHRRTARIINYDRGDVLIYKGPEFWQAARMSMTWLREARPTEIDDVLGGGWLVPGGLQEALKNHDRIVLFDIACWFRAEGLAEQLGALGFTQTGEAYQVRSPRAANYTIMQGTDGTVLLFERNR